MTDVTVTQSAGPVPESERLRTLDLLRGFALLGIFMVNMQFFAMVFSEIFKPSVYDDAPLIDVLAWGFVKTFFEYKFISLFSLLFGAGMVMQMMRADAKGRRFVPTYLRRMAVLAMIGLIHGYLLWYGDILFVYAVGGTLLLIARKWRPRTLLITAGGIIGFFFVAQLTIGVIVFGAMGGFDTGSNVDAEPVAAAMDAEQPVDPPAADVVEEAQEAKDEEVEEAEPEIWSEKNPKLAERFPWMAVMFDARFDFTSDGWETAETRAYAEGPFTEALAFRAFTYTLAILMAVVGYGWRVLATFLIGAAFMKLGFFNPAARRWHRRLFIFGLAIGVPCELANAWLTYLAAGENIGLALFGAALHEPGSLLMCVGFVGATGMIVNSGAIPRLVRAISAVGRLALTNYLLQTVVATGLMYSWGLGYFGDIPRPWQIVLVLGIYAIQIPLSVVWLRFFTIGPMEWIWRSLTYNSRQPMRRRRS